jgi:hypothetical protein
MKRTPTQKRSRNGLDAYWRAVSVYDDLLTVLRDLEPAQRENFIALVMCTLQLRRAPARKGGAR